jgi:hypothetical protein
MAGGRAYEFYLKGDNGRYDRGTRIVLPSVTTIVSAVFAKPQLVPWSVNTTIDGIVGLVSAYADRLRDPTYLSTQERTFEDRRADPNAVNFEGDMLDHLIDTLTDHELLLEALTLNGLNHESVSDTASERGTAAHALLQALCSVYRIKGQDGAMRYAERMLAATKDPYRRAVAGWWLNTEPEPLFSEHVVKSLRHRYAGRLDLITTTGLKDLKTRRADLSAYKSDDMQMSLYKQAVLEEGLLEGTVLEGKELGRTVLLASEDGLPAREVDSWVPDEAALKIVELYYLLRKTRVK